MTIGKTRSKSSHRWLNRQAKDPYTQNAKKEGYRSRAAYKLLEIQSRDAIFKSGSIVVDLGAAPGGWSQVAANSIGQSGRVFALDKLALVPLPGVDIILGDFEDPETAATLSAALQGSAVDLVLSDMAPNMSGMMAVDQPRSIYLAELALDFALGVLGPGGCFLVKTFQGEGFEAYWSMLKEHFEKVMIRKPRASRVESREVYVLAKGFISSKKEVNKL